MKAKNLDLDKLRQYVNKEMEGTKTIESKSDFVTLRMLAITKLTILNARRGSEPAKISLNDFADRATWIGEERNVNNWRERGTLASELCDVHNGERSSPCLRTHPERL